MAMLSTRLAVLVAAIALAMGVMKLEKSKHSADFIEYASNAHFRECIAWDSQAKRFLVSGFDGSIGQIAQGSDSEVRVLKDDDYAGNATLGLHVDAPRNRLLVAINDLRSSKYSALAAYDLRTWRRLFLTELSGSGEEATMADGVAVDAEGNAYVTDAKRNIIWKVGPEGNEHGVISHRAFKSAKRRVPVGMVGLNGIVYHPDGFLLVVHTWAGVLFRVKLGPQNGDDFVENVQEVKMSRLVLMGDGLALASPQHLVIAGALPSGRMVESTDDWFTARLTHRYLGPLHRIATSTAIVPAEDAAADNSNGTPTGTGSGKVFISFLLGWNRHLITQAVFSPVASSD